MVKANDKKESIHSRRYDCGRASFAQPWVRVDSQVRRSCTLGRGRGLTSRHRYPPAELHLLYTLPSLSDYDF